MGICVPLSRPEAGVSQGILKAHLRALRDRTFEWPSEEAV